MVVAHHTTGPVLATWLTDGLLGWRFSILALSLLILARFCYKAIAGRHESIRFGISPQLPCAHCGKAIGMFRRLAHHHFCCDDHELAYLDKLDEIAIQRLHNARMAAPSPAVELVSHGDNNSNVADREVVTPIVRRQQQTLGMNRTVKSSRSQSVTSIRRRDVVTNVWMFARMISATLTYSPETTSPDLL